MSENDADCTAAICKCGGMVYVIVTHHIDAAERKEIGKLAADGYDIKHLMASAVRAGEVKFGCKCVKEGDLFAAEATR